MWKGIHHTVLCQVEDLKCSRKKATHPLHLDHSNFLEGVLYEQGRAYEEGRAPKARLHWLSKGCFETWDGMICREALDQLSPTCESKKHKTIKKHTRNPISNSMQSKLGRATGWYCANMIKKYRVTLYESKWSKSLNTSLIIAFPTCWLSSPATKSAPNSKATGGSKDNSLNVELGEAAFAKYLKKPDSIFSRLPRHSQSTVFFELKLVQSFEFENCIKLDQTLGASTKKSKSRHWWCKRWWIPQWPQSSLGWKMWWWPSRRQWMPRKRSSEMRMEEKIALSSVLQICLCWFVVTAIDIHDISRYAVIYSIPSF